MATRLFSLLSGLIYLTLGILACVPQFDWWPECPRLEMRHLYFDGGQLTGFIAENLPHNLLWIIIGAIGVFATFTFATSVLYARSLFVLMVLFVFTGLMPLGIGDLWGVLPLSGWNILLHAVTAMLAWYYGFPYPYDREMAMAA